MENCKEPVLEQLRRNCNWLDHTHTLRRNDDIIAKQAHTVKTARLHRKTAIHEYLKNRSGARNVDGGLQLQLEEDGSSSTRQNKSSVEYASLRATSVRMGMHFIRTLSFLSNPQTRLCCLVWAYTYKKLNYNKEITVLFRHT